MDFSDQPLKHARSTIEKIEHCGRHSPKIERAITEVLADNSSRPLAIGIGVPGLVDATNGIALHYKHINKWKNVALTAPLAEKIGVPVYLENCVRSMALAEMWLDRDAASETFFASVFVAALAQASWPAANCSAGRLPRGRNWALARSLGQFLGGPAFPGR